MKNQENSYLLSINVRISKHPAKYTYFISKPVYKLQSKFTKRLKTLSVAIISKTVRLLYRPAECGLILYLLVSGSVNF